MEPKMDLGSWLDGLTAAGPDTGAMLAEARSLAAAQKSGDTQTLLFPTLLAGSHVRAGAVVSPADSGLKPAQVFGPFKDRVGRAQWIQVFPRVRNLRLVRNAGGPAFLILSVELRAGVLGVVAAPIKQPLSYKLPQGGVWIQSRALAAAAPATGYTGLAIKGGTLTFSAPVVIGVASDEVIVPAGVAVTLDLTLNPPPATPFAGGPGRDARAAAAAFPDQVQVSFAAAGASLRIADAARLLMFGCDVALDFTADAPRYVADRNEILVAAAASIPAFTVAGALSDLFTPSGHAPITQAGWLLPVAAIDPAHLNQPSGVGELGLFLDAGLRAAQIGQAGLVALNATVASFNGQILTLKAGAATGERLVLSPTLRTNSTDRLELSWNPSFPIQFATDASGTESLLTLADLKASFAEPVDVNGWRLPLQGTDAFVAVLADAQGVTLWVEAQLQPTSRQAVAFALTNAVLTSGWPGALIFAGRFDGQACKSGGVLLIYRLLAMMPTLPDPYASSVPGWSRGDVQSSLLYSVLMWTPAASSFDFVLPSSGQLPLGGAGQTAGLASAALTLAASTSDALASGRVSAGDAFAFEAARKTILVDVSSNVSQFGVAVSRGDGAFTPVTIRNLTLQVGGPNLSLLTLPAVQWEAVFTEKDPETPTFPDKLTFPNSGVPSVISVPTVALVPVQPEAALEALLNNFQSAAPQPSRARFTLPFGIVARAELRATNAAQPNGATVSLNRPHKDALTGAHQVSIEARDLSLGADQTPALPGYALQLAVGQPAPGTVLDVTPTDIFNTYLGPTGVRPLAPVVRLDLSGYGESLFSDWRNPYNDAVAVEQARFDVLSGRTAFEVVKVRTVQFPHAVKYVRTITIERKNSGVVVRRDSGWKAVSDGVYDFPAAMGINTHPGVVRRLTHVTNIRETGQIITVDGFDLATVFFDGDLEIEGVPDLVPAKNQTGFIQVSAGTLTANVYADALAQLGAMGGPIDANLNVGGGPVSMRLHQVDVAATQGLAGPEFAMAVWGSQRFPGGGEWSSLQVAGPTAAPQTAPQGKGVPLVRAGLAGAAPPANSPYRFAEPRDVDSPNNPLNDYGILHSTGTQRVFFRRPRIDATALNRIVSSEIPALADPYILGGGEGPFPELDKTLPFPSNVWALIVDAGGHYRLELPASPFPLTVGRRTLRQSGTVKGDVDYTGAQVTYAVDTSQPVAWQFALDGTTKIMNSSAFGDMIMVKANIRAAADQPSTAFRDPRLKLGGALSVVQNLLTILADLGIQGVMTAQMTNSWSLKVKVTVPVVDAMGDPLQIPPLVPFPDIKFDDTGVEVEIDVLPTADQAKFKVGGTPMIAVKQIPGLYVIGIIEFSIQISTTDGTVYGLLLGFGVAYELQAGPFELKGEFALTMFGFAGDTVLGFGIGFLLKLGIDLKIIAVQISLEGQLAVILACKGAPTETLFGAAKLTFGIEITVCLIFSIDIEVETETSKALRGPGEPACKLPDVIPDAA